MHVGGKGRHDWLCGDGGDGGGDDDLVEGQLMGRGGREGEMGGERLTSVFVGQAGQHRQLPHHHCNQLPRHLEADGALPRHITASTHCTAYTHSLTRSLRCTAYTVQSYDFYLSYSSRKIRRREAQAG